jgi:hypothetical protein
MIKVAVSLQWCSASNHMAMGVMLLWTVLGVYNIIAWKTCKKHLHMGVRKGMLCTV